MSDMKKGDRVRVNDPGELGHGQSGEVRSTSPDGEFANVKLDSGRTIQFALELLEPEAKESRERPACTLEQKLKAINEGVDQSGPVFDAALDALKDALEVYIADMVSLIQTQRLGSPERNKDTKKTQNAKTLLAALTGFKSARRDIERQSHE